MSGYAIAAAAGFAAGVWIRWALMPVCIAFKIGGRTEQIRRSKTSQRPGRHARRHLRLIEGGRQ